jgi:hypothetical protein
VEEVTAVRAGVERWLAVRHGPQWKSVARIASHADRITQASQGLFVFKPVLAPSRGSACWSAGSA